MVIYGIKLDFDDSGWDLQEELDDLDNTDFPNVVLVSGYSVSGYEPEMAVYGIRLDSGSTLFNPTTLSDLITASEKLTEDHIVELAKALKAANLITSRLRRMSLSETPEIYIFEETDD